MVKEGQWSLNLEAIFQNHFASYMKSLEGTYQVCKITQRKQNRKFTKRDPNEVVDFVKCECEIQKRPRHRQKNVAAIVLRSKALRVFDLRHIKAHSH